MSLEDIQALPVSVGFNEARQRIRAVLEACERAGIKEDAIQTALLAELLPGLVRAWGPQGVAVVLGRLGDQLSSGELARQLRQ